MPLSVRLDNHVESLLEETASTLNTSKADIVKKSLTEYCTRILSERRKRPYELIKDLLNKRGSGKGDLAAKSEEILRERFKKA
jgi:hypothetical protein